MQIKPILQFLLFLVTCSISSSFAETYTWTDKQGHKHFGDEIPPEYATHAKPVDTKSTNTIPAIQPTDDDSGYNNQTKGAATTINIPNSLPKESDACTKQKNEYLNAQLCYNKCRLSGGGINKAKCSDCADVKKPDC